MARKPAKPRESSKTSPLTRLSANFMAALDQDFQENGPEAIRVLREEFPAKYSEIASRLIMTESAGNEIGQAQTMEEIARGLLRTVGVEAPSKRQIAAASKANDQFVAKLERIAGVAKDDSANGKPANIEHETAMMTAYVDGAEQ